MLGKCPSAELHPSPLFKTFYFEMETCFVAETDLELKILLPQPPAQLVLTVVYYQADSRLYVSFL